MDLRVLVLACVSAWVCCSGASVEVSQPQPPHYQRQLAAAPTTPVPILKQINRQNDDGSYSYGYEAADGSFKIETKYPNGDVAGKYGYVDEAGQRREVTYGATKQTGFVPEGAGIQVPPPFVNEKVTNELKDGQEDDGQYREDPKIYEDPKYNGRNQKFTVKPSSAVKQFHRPSVTAIPQFQHQPLVQQQPQVQLQPQVQHQPQVQQHYQSSPQYQPQPAAIPSGSLYQQETLLSPSNHLNHLTQSQSRPQSVVYHQQPQFSYQAYTPQPFQQQYQPQQFQSQTQYSAQPLLPEQAQLQAQSTFASQPQLQVQPQFQPQQQYQPQPQFQSQPHFHQQPQYPAQPQFQTQPQHSYQNYNPFHGHPAQGFDPLTGSYSINYSG